MAIDEKKMSNEDLLKMYKDKCKYCETLEDRLINQNKKIDDYELEINSLHVDNHISKKKYVNLKKKYNELYEFAENLCDVINKKDNDFDKLIKINDELRSVNEKLQDEIKKNTMFDFILEAYEHTERFYETIRKVLS